jgi:signal transduction histidine kinase
MSADVLCDFATPSASATLGVADEAGDRAASALQNAGPMSLPAVLRECRAHVLANVDARARRELVPSRDVPAAGDGSLGSFLDALIDGIGAEAPSAAAWTAATRHGEERHHHGVDASHVVREYGHLNDVVLDLARRHGAPDHLANLVTRDVFSGAAAAVAAHAAAEARRQARWAGEHVAVFAHEVRNRLSIAMALVWRSRRAGNLERLATVIDGELHHLAGTLEDQLALARLGALPEGRVTQLEIIAVAELAATIAGDHAELAALRGVKINVDASPALSLRADARLVRAAVTNLVANGVKFTRDRGGIMLRVRATGRGGGIAFEVEDECGGLPPGDPARLFDPFVQAAPDRSGYGLGLAIVRAVADAHRGFVEIADLPGKGCVFRLTFPGA